MKKKQSSSGTISNRRARHDYELGDGLIVGIALSGAETKSLRHGHGNLRGAYVTTKDGELWLVNATITGGRGIIIDEAEQTRSRKLLAKRREINQLLDAKQQGQSIIPTEILIKGRYIKLRVATGRGKKRYDKREVIKQRDQGRLNATELKRSLR